MASGSVDGSALARASTLVTLWVHEDSFSREDVVVRRNLLAVDPKHKSPLGRITALERGTHVRDFEDVSPTIVVTDEKQPKSHPREGQRDVASGAVDGKSYLFPIKEAAEDLADKHPLLAVSIHTTIARVLGFTHLSMVDFTTVEEASYAASHVEVVFRDMYLTRADMWRMIAATLSGKSVFQGQKLVFMSSIKATIKNVFIDCRRVQSAFFTDSTKPVFRSESARYVLYIHMSKEMWEFDNERSGEIYFDKVIHGFLPTLFNRWNIIDAKHLVSIILFTRLEFSPSVVPTFASTTSYDVRAKDASSALVRDFYRVVVSEMSNIEWPRILYQLKKEFQTFRGTISTWSTNDPGIPGSPPKSILMGELTIARKGNVLEAINLALSQYAADHVDRDLTRTGLSVVVVTPGAGDFEVDQDLLQTTSDRLVSNGIGVDLVCLSQMPLHSVPIFKYKAKQRIPALMPPIAATSVDTTLEIEESAPLQSLHAMNTHGLRSLQHPSSFNSAQLCARTDGFKAVGSDWSYAMPHWVDVSFWKDGGIFNEAVGHPDMFLSRVRTEKLLMSGSAQDEPNVIKAHYAQMPWLHDGLHHPESDEQRSRRKGDERANKELQALQHAASERPKSYLPALEEHMAKLSLGEFPARQEAQSWMDDYDETAFVLADYRGTNLESKSVSGSLKSSSNSSSDPLSLGSLQSIPGSRGRPEVWKSPSIIRPQVNRSISGVSLISLKRERHGFYPSKAGVTAAVSGEFQASSTLSPSRKSDTETTSRAHLDRFRKIANPLLLSAASSTTQESYDDRSLSSMNSLQAKHTKDEKAEQAPHSRVADEFKNLGHSSVARSTSQPNLLLESPWMTVLNPLNSQEKANSPAYQAGKWQHVFPRPLRTTAVNWKSLCSPAALPITIGELSTSEQLELDFQSTIYHINLANHKDKAEDSALGDLLREIVAFRLSLGFQLVVGDAAAKHAVRDQSGLAGVFTRVESMEGSALVPMSSGSQVHLLTSGANSIEVKVYRRKPREGLKEPIVYRPWIQTLLAKKYECREVVINSPEQKLDWAVIDNYIAGRLTGLKTQDMSFWSARFVLLPVDLPTPERRPESVRGDRDDEVRLEGIRQLTAKLWQRNRSQSFEKRWSSDATKDLKDPNPLSIEYQTKDPSVVVQELNGTDMAVFPIPQSNQGSLFSKVDYDLKTLAEELQGPNGVPIKTRWWYWMRHPNALVASDLVTWLQSRFKDIDDREEAVEFGKRLFEDGLLVHVRDAHGFRDGNFYFRIHPDHQIIRQNVSPAAPWAASPFLAATGAPTRLRNGSSNADSPQTSVSSEASKTTVRLSEKISINVDPRNRSYRPEIIDLHYDRIHNPDNCYHVRVEWMNTTAKLVEDAVVDWAELVANYGLKLVELPIAEASAITSVHPFRRPYSAELALQPPLPPTPRRSSLLSTPHQMPSTPRQTPFSSAQSQVSADKFAWHKHLLRKLGFVLDYESADSFPWDKPVTYSWGKPDYQLTQFVHKSGVILAQITKEGNFLLLANRLCSDRAATIDAAKPELMLTAEGLQLEVEAFCKDKGKLRQFYSAGLNPAPVATPAANVRRPSSPVPPLDLNAEQAAGAEGRLSLEKDRVVR